MRVSLQDKIKVGVSVGTLILLVWAIKNASVLNEQVANFITNWLETLSYVVQKVVSILMEAN